MKGDADVDIDTDEKHTTPQSEGTGSPKTACPHLFACNTAMRKA